MWLFVATIFASGLAALPYTRVSLAIPYATAAELPAEMSRDVIHALLFNTYRAFDHRDENVIYDRLKKSIAGDLLLEVYIQVRRSTELSSQGGARVKIDQVDVLEAEPLPGSSRTPLKYRCRWTASGSVGHWGHIHRRTNQYQADIELQPVDNAWKITALDVRDETRIDAGTR